MRTTSSRHAGPPRRQPTDADWLRAGRLRHYSTAPTGPVSPENLTNWYWACLREGDAAAALYFGIEVVELLHTTYVIDHMVARRPGLDDLPLLRNCLQAIDEVARVRPGAPIDAEITHVIDMLLDIVVVGGEHNVTAAALSPYLEAIRNLNGRAGRHD